MEMERKKGLSGFALKLVAIITMVIDHIGATIVERSMIARGFNEAAHKGSKSLNEWMNNPISNYMLYDLNNLMRSVGRLAFPLFCFLLVEGFEHTKSKKKYALRMALFCLISEIPFNLAFATGWIALDQQNVFFTLTLGLLAMWGISAIKEHAYEGIIWKVLKQVSFFLFGVTVWYTVMRQTILGAIITSMPIFEPLYTQKTVFGMIAELPNKEFWLLAVLCGLLAITIFNFATARKEEEKVISEALSWFPVYGAMLLAQILMTDYASAGVLTIVLMYFFRAKKTKEMLVGCIVLTLMNPSEVFAFLDLVFVYLYNGTRGKSIKYFFYAFYPVHLTILYLIGHCMGIM